MVMNDLNKDFMEKVLNDAVWKKMSKELSWNETLMEKYKDKINWMEISENGNILWTSSMLEKFKGLLDWNILSDSSVECLFTQTNLERFEKYWNWSILSGNWAVKFTTKLIDRFVDNWDWKKLIDIHRGLEALYTEEFLNKYNRYIPASELQSSVLWSEIIESKTEELTLDILSSM